MELCGLVVWESLNSGSHEDRQACEGKGRGFCVGLG